MKIDPNRYETLTGIRSHYALRSTTIRWQVSRAAEKSLAGTPDGVDVGAIALADGTVLANLEKFAEWARSRKPNSVIKALLRAIEKEEKPKRGTPIDPAEYMTFSNAADNAGLNRKSVFNAVDRKELPIIVLPFGSRLVRPKDIQQWEKDYQTKTYEADVGVLFTRSHKKPGWRKPTTSFKTHNLSRWAEISKIPARVLLKRINDGMKFAEALTTPVGKKER